MGETHRLSDQAIRLASALSTKNKWGAICIVKLTRCQMRTSGSRQHSALRASGGAAGMRETHLLSDMAIGLSLAVGTKCKRGSHLHGRTRKPVGCLYGRNSQAVRSGRWVPVSTCHQPQAGEPSAWEILTCYRIRPSGLRQNSAPTASGGGMCMGRTHHLSDPAIGPASALGTQSKRATNLHGRNSQAVASSHRARVRTRHLQPAGEPSAWSNSLAVGSGHWARVSTRHQEQEGEIFPSEKLTCCRIRPSGSCQRSAHQ